MAFSSAAALLGAPGQGNYAAANAAMDSFVASQAARGLPLVSVQWGAWGAGEASSHILQSMSCSAVRRKVQELGVLSCWLIFCHAFHDPRTRCLSTNSQSALWKMIHVLLLLGLAHIPEIRILLLIN